MKALREAAYGNHHFTSAYIPCVNGTEELVCHELIRSLRALLSEFQLPFRCWLSIQTIDQSSLNNSLLSRIKGRCALTVFKGLPKDSPKRSIKQKSGKHDKVSSITEVRTRQVMKVEELTKALEEIRKIYRLKCSQTFYC